MGGCCSLCYKNNEIGQENNYVEEIVLEEFDRRYNALIQQEYSNKKVDDVCSEPPGLILLKRRLHNLGKPLEELENNPIENNDSDYDDIIDTETLKSRLRLLLSNTPTPNFKSLNKKEIEKLKKAEEKLIEYEVRLAKIQEPIIINQTLVLKLF